MNMVDQFFSHREVVQSTKEALVALQRKNPAIQPVLAIIQVLEIKTVQKVSVVSNSHCKKQN